MERNSTMTFSHITSFVVFHPFETLWTLATERKPFAIIRERFANVSHGQGHTKNYYTGACCLESSRHIHTANVIFYVCSENG